VNKLQTKILANKYKQYVIEMRREFHKHPEPSLKEFRTARRVKEELEKMGIPCFSVAGTGVVGIIEGAGPGRTIALRADMDALELCEKNDIDYKSVNEGYMHGCGHDGHTAMLLGAAKILNELKSTFNGKVKLLFQPAEELAQGAQMMVAEGVMDGVDEVFGMHLWSGLQSGKVSVDPGPRLAATDLFKITVKGKGGHGSMPHQGVDAVVAASAVVMNLQSLVSREISPLESAVVSVGVFKAGTRFNVIASEAVLEGSTRCFNKEIREGFPAMIERVAKNTAASYRAEAELEYTFSTPPNINDENGSRRAAGTVEKLLGREGVVSMEKATGGEDFAFFLEKAPGVLAFLGAGNSQKQADYPHHHERFNIDEDALEIGVALYAQYAIDYLNE
jgi:amidohydrolase